MDKSYVEYLVLFYADIFSYFTHCCRGMDSFLKYTPTEFLFRNMLKNGYIRIGKYFTRPYEVPSSDRIHCSPKYVFLNFCY